MGVNSHDASADYSERFPEVHYGWFCYHPQMEFDIRMKITKARGASPGSVHHIHFHRAHEECNSRCETIPSPDEETTG